MPRPVVGIYAHAAPASWGPWVDRPSVIAPAALGDAVQRAGAMVVLLAPDPDLARHELLELLDALIAFDGAEGVQALVAAARSLGLAVLVLDPDRVTPGTASADLDGEIRGLLAA